ncbi:GNAT family N-acetyltransferase [Kineosporia sp. J2-2]|uniref:GNAT family N-acetyltransferase n=1 Tax=Kineosporia corallincola TaxID=2835133 RepID=A0ABS5TCJ3_9ACTN|nr:GNAT family N-acetyltransferase [Kineosporia corallincola]MBT0768798.1 GNAT family N-acetyltransferase [Kineosporia corallincola]
MTAVQATGQADAADAADATGGTHPLDNPAWGSISGAHRHLAEGRAEGAKALRYPADISPLAAISAFDDPEAWEQLAGLVAPGETVFFPGPPSLPELVPAGWTIGMSLPGVQLIATDRLRPRPDPEAVVLGPDDVDEMLDLVARTRPGPFERRTVLLGTYLGIRHEGALVAMAGERMHPPGYTEISAVCTDPAFRGRGLAGRLVLAVAQVISERGDTPIMHAAAGNTHAIGIYEKLGFTLRWRPTFFDFRTPGA